MIMNTIDPSLQRYQTLRKRFSELPADRDGLRMNTQHMPVDEFKGSISMGSRTDSDPATHDILNLSTEGHKGGSRAETFVEVPGKRTWIFGKKSNDTLVHLSRKVSHLPGGYGLSEVAMRTVDLVTGKAVSELHDDKAIKAAQDLEGSIPFRIHYNDPIGHQREQENLLR